MLGLALNFVQYEWMVSDILLSPTYLSPNHQRKPFRWLPSLKRTINRENRPSQKESSLPARRRGSHNKKRSPGHKQFFCSQFSLTSQGRCPWTSPPKLLTHYSKIFSPLDMSTSTSNYVLLPWLQIVQVVSGRASTTTLFRHLAAHGGQKGSPTTTLDWVAGTTGGRRRPDWIVGAQTANKTGTQHPKKTHKPVALLGHEQRAPAERRWATGPRNSWNVAGREPIGPGPRRDLNRLHARPLLQDVWKNATENRFTDELLDLYQQRRTTFNFSAASLIRVSATAFTKGVSACVHLSS